MNLKFNEIKNIEIGFTDLKGNLREIIIPSTRLEEVKTFGLNCDGSSVGLKDVSKSDLKIFIDEDAKFQLPNGNEFFIANLDYHLDCRKTLMKLETNLTKNLKPQFAVEIEFFMFENNKKLDNLNYFEVENSKSFDCLNEILKFCVSVNFPIESFHHECANGQFEINFKKDLPHKTADNLIFLKKVICFYAKKYDLVVDFSPKPFKHCCGSGMHTNISFLKDDENIFYDEEDKLNLSQFAYDFSSGIIKHLPAICAISNSRRESYKRIFSGKETPKNICISSMDRTALIRVPNSNKNSKRIEFRLPDCTSNPYLLFSAILVAGFDGAKNKFRRAVKLPKSLKGANKAMKTDELISKLKS